jgi:hypothetical protein
MIISSNMPRKGAFKDINDYYQAVMDSGLELQMLPEDFIKYLKWKELKYNKWRQYEEPSK